jgi:hypothetical protein
MRRGPQLLHDLHLLLGAAAAIVEILVEPNEFDLVPADADAEPEPAAAQGIEAGGLLGDQRGLALRQDQHAGREAELWRHAGQIAEQDERVVIQAGSGAVGVGATGRVGAEHVVGRLDKVVADRLGRLRIFAQHGRIAADIAQGQQASQFHRLSPAAG